MTRAAVPVDARARAALALLDLGPARLRPDAANLTPQQAAALDTLDGDAPVVVIARTEPGVGSSYLLRALALRWAARHPDCRLLLTGPDELDLRRAHLEGRGSLPELLRSAAAESPGDLAISASRSRAQLPGGSEIRWGAVPASGDLSHLLVARTDGVLVEGADALGAETTARLVDSVLHAPGPPRRAVLVVGTPAPAWLAEDWPVVELGTDDEIPAPSTTVTVPGAAAPEVEDLPPTPAGDDPGPRDDDRAELEEIHARREAGELDLIVEPERWSEIVAAERLRREWEAWRLCYDEGGELLPAEEISRRRAAEAERCRGDVIYWLLRYGVIQEPRGQEVVDLPLVPWPAQVGLVRYLVDRYRRGEPALVWKAREIGATWGDRHVAWWLWWSVPGYSELIGTYDWGLIDDGSTDSVFGMLRYIHEHQPAWMRPDLDAVHEDRVAHLTHPEHGANIVGRRPKANFGRGRRRSRVVLDEAPFWPRRVQTALRTSLQSTTNCVVRMGTPNAPGDEFHRLVELSEKDDAEVTAYAMPWWHDPRKSITWYEGLVPRELTWEERERERNLGFVVISSAGIFRVSDLERFEVEETGEVGLVYDDEDLPRVIRDMDHLRQLPGVGMMDFGTGPSLVAYVHAAVLLVPDDDPWILFDRCMVWPRTPAAEIAAELRGEILDSERYGVHLYLGGDPTGQNRESDQESWEDRLNAAGWPIRCLAHEANTPLEISENLTQWQRLMDRGRILYHRTRAGVLIRAVERWTWSVPEGLDPQDANREVIKPRKDRYSHPGDAGRYCIYYITRHLRVRKPEDAGPVRLPAETGNPVDLALDRLRGASW